MKERLSHKRVRFTQCVQRLLAYAESQGIYVALDQVARDPRTAEAYAANGLGIVNSVHILGLAVDLVMYTDQWEYVIDGRVHQQLGDYWKTLDPAARWGGDWGDGNHYSFEHEGRK